MKRYFLTIFLVFVGLNICYKSYIYFSSDKVTGKVIDYEYYANRYSHTSEYSGKKSVSTEYSKSPIVEYSFDNIFYHQSRNKWGYINQLDVNDEVTVLIRDKEGSAEINTFFQFWFTFYDMIAAFSLCVVGTIILSNVLPEKEKKPAKWE
jgi:hypothetical protein